MIRKMTGKTGIVVVIAALILMAAHQRAMASPGNISGTDKYAWSETAGWQNYMPTHGGVTVSMTHLSGYTWAENIGWIKLGATGSGPYSNTGTTDWGVNHDGNGNLSGYAWSETAGWINFNPTHGQVTVNTTTGAFSGYAWSENVGWIHFANASPSYAVKIKDSDNDGYCVLSDCDDNDAQEYPNQKWYADNDSDLYGDSSDTAEVDCLRPSGKVANNTDCDDTDSSVNPGRREGPKGSAVCSDTKDNDCDGLIDLADRMCVVTAMPWMQLLLE